MHNIVCIFGTRPEAIKMAPLIRTLETYGQQLKVSVCVTGQHREMLDQVLDFFAIKPQLDLHVMEPNQSLASLTSRIMDRVDRVFLDLKPHLVLVHGDTTTTFCAALAGFYHKIPVGHVEAGLRTHHPMSPFPEEMNRRLVSRMATLHFAPTLSAQQNLLKEGVPPESIMVTGNTAIDALLLAVAEHKIREFPLPCVLEPGGKMVLVTLHRRENFGQGVVHICQALAELIQTFRDVDFVLCVHLNPQVKGPMETILAPLAASYPNLHLVPPQAYPAFTKLMVRCHLILTDSGGLQEEAPSLHKPVLLMRDRTERPEGVDAQLVRLVGSDHKTIVASVSSLLQDPEAYNRMVSPTNPFGDGQASQRIGAHILQFLGHHL